MPKLQVYSSNAWHAPTIKARHKDQWITPATIQYYDNNTWKTIDGETQGYVEDMSSWMTVTSATKFGETMGMNYHFEESTWTGDCYKHKTVLPYAQTMGIQVGRLFMPWVSVEATAGTPSWTLWDSMVDEMLAKGQTVMLSIYGVRDYGTPITTTAMRTAWAEWAARVVNHYKGKKVVYEIWCEPSSYIFWGGTPSGSDYVALLSAAVTAMRAVHDKCCILAVCTCPDIGETATWQQGAADTLDWAWLNQCFDAGLMSVDFDGFSTHPYRGNEPEDIWRDMETLVTKMGSNVKPFIITEMGYTRDYLNVMFPGSGEAVQAIYAQRSYLFAFYLGCRANIHYVMIDDSTGDSNADSFGTMNKSLSPYNSYNYIKQLNDYLGDKCLTYKYMITESYDIIMYFANTTSGYVVYWTAGASHSQTIYDGTGGTTTVTMEIWPQYLAFTPTS